MFGGVSDRVLAPSGRMKRPLFPVKLRNFVEALSSRERSCFIGAPPHGISDASSGVQLSAGPVFNYLFTICPFSG
jgi:hypothetical protein